MIGGGRVRGRDCCRESCRICDEPPGRPTSTRHGQFSYRTVPVIINLSVVLQERFYLLALKFVLPSFVRRRRMRHITTDFRPVFVHIYLSLFTIEHVPSSSINLKTPKMTDKPNGFAQLSPKNQNETIKIYEEAGPHHTTDHSSRINPTITIPTNPLVLLLILPPKSIHLPPVRISRLLITRDRKERLQHTLPQHRPFQRPLFLRVRQTRMCRHIDVFGIGDGEPQSFSGRWGVRAGWGERFEERFEDGGLDALVGVVGDRAGCEGE